MTRRLILIDSPPNGGAKQLRHALEDHLSGSFTVASVEKNEGWRFFDAIKPALLGRSNVILEGTWYPHAHKMDGAELQMLERAALTCGKVHVVCRPSRYLGEREGLDVMDVLLADDHARIEFDINATLHSDIGSFIRRELLPAIDQSPICPEPYVGRYAERAIAIVADKPKFAGFNPPFISFRRDGVSWWLADGMRRAGLLEQFFVWVNCRSADEVETDPGPLIALRPEKVFALGDQAAKWCAEYEIDCTIHKHPISWKRFNPTKPYPLVSDLVKAVGALR